MTREEKIQKMANLAECSGFVCFENSIETSKGRGDIIDKYGLLEDIDGDWCIVGEWKDFTDNDIDEMFEKMLNYAQKVLAMA